MRTIKTHPTNCINLTPRAETIMLLLNCYKLLFPNASLKSAAEYLGISETNARRYYYGIHHNNEFGNTYTQMRKGSSVPITLSKDTAMLTLSYLSDYKELYNF